jgi:hypothetical protein
MLFSPAANGNSCELVVVPSPSARPPHEKMSVVSPAARRGSKFMQPLVSLLTISVELAALLCAPEVMKSHFSLEEPSQGLRAIGIRFSRKSPAVGSTKRQVPRADLRDTEVKARVAVVSKTLASAAAEGLRTPPARETGTAERGAAEVAVPDVVVGGGGVVVVLDEEAAAVVEEAMVRRVLEVVVDDTETEVDVSSTVEVEDAEVAADVSSVSSSGGSAGHSSAAASVADASGAAAALVVAAESPKVKD